VNSGQTARSVAYHEGPGVTADHFLYRCYDRDGDLLYIGCTVNVKSRIAAHRRASNGARASRWLSVFMDRYETEGPFRGREAGRDAERQAINAEQPLFNYQERASENLAAWMTRRPVAQYLVERGAVRLAMETACRCFFEIREAGGYDEHCIAHVAAAANGLTNLPLLDLDEALRLLDEAS
jgi:hypothetical protein